MAMKVAEIAVAAGNTATAKAILAGLVSRRPALAEPRIRLASLQLGGGDADTAIRTLQSIQDVKGGSANIRPFWAKPDIGWGWFNEADGVFFQGRDSGDRRNII